MKNVNSGRGLAITSMVLGILGLILDIIALIKRQGGMAIAGLILSIIAIAISFAMAKPIATNQTNNQQPTSTTTQQNKTSEEKKTILIMNMVLEILWKLKIKKVMYFTQLL